MHILKAQQLVLAHLVQTGLREGYHAAVRLCEQQIPSRVSVSIMFEFVLVTLFRFHEVDMVGLPALDTNIGHGSEVLAAAESPEPDVSCVLSWREFDVKILIVFLGQSHHLLGGTGCIRTAWDGRRYSNTTLRSLGCQFELPVFGSTSPVHVGAVHAPDDMHGWHPPVFEQVIAMNDCMFGR